MQPPPSHSHIRTTTWLSFRLVNTTSTCSSKSIYLPGNSPPAPIPQTLSAARISSPSRPLAAVLFMSTPDPSQAQLRPRHLKPYLQEFCRCNCNHKWIIIPFICTTSSVLSCTIVCTTRPPLLYARYLSRPPLSHAPHSGTLLLPPLSVCALYGRCPPPPPHKSPLSSSSSSRRVSPWIFRLFCNKFLHLTDTRPYPLGCISTCISRSSDAINQRIHRWMVWLSLNAEGKMVFLRAYIKKLKILDEWVLPFSFMLCLVLCLSYPIMSTCAWAEHAGHHFIYLIAVSGLQTDQKISCISKICSLLRYRPTGP